MKKNVHGNRFHAVAADSAVDWDHPLNRGRLAWWYAPRGVPFGGNRWLDLTRKNVYSKATTNNNSNSAPMMAAAQNGMLFNGSSQYASISGSYTFTTITMCAWVYLLSNPAVPAGIVFNRNGASTASGLNLGGSGAALNFAWNDDSNTYDHDGPSIPIGDWAFIASTLDPVTLWNYVGTRSTGLQGILNTFATANSSGTRDQWEIGRDNIGRYFPGYVREASIYNRVLSSSELNRLFQFGLNNYQTPDSPLRWFSTRTYSVPAATFVPNPSVVQAANPAQTFETIPY